ncbi:hypothetical protein [Nocardiopsis ganjiahuensis]|uniref:hypothetical protein n=1 Tax=Nocardiopsis ganjiahuensis TaxID=239984 RepID=UPI00034D467F
MPHVDELRRQFLAAAETGDEDTRVIAVRLSEALAPATRLTLLDALAAATDEITRDLAPGSVEVRLRGERIEFIVTPPPTDEPTGTAHLTSDRRHHDVAPLLLEGEEGGTSRITLRLPDHLKPHVEEAARSEGQSVNAWLVRAVAGALGPEGRRTAPRTSHQIGRDHTGWVR